MSKALPEVKEIVAPSTSFQGLDIGSLISKALDSGTDGINALEKLLDMEERQRSRMGVIAFNEAKSNSQMKMPTITKGREVWNTSKTAVTYRYASLDDARAAIMGHIAKFGFSDRFDTEIKEKGMLVTYYVTHSAGHTEKVSMHCPMESSNYMSDIQKSGSTSTYGKRYTFCNFWGIVLDEDNDGKKKKEEDETKAWKALRHKVNPRLLELNDLKTFNELKEKFEKNYPDKMDKLTFHKDGETFGGLFSEHEERIIKLIAKKAQDEQDIFDKNVHECETFGDFEFLESLLNANPGLDTMENNQKLSEAGSKIGAPGY